MIGIKMTIKIKKYLACTKTHKIHPTNKCSKKKKYKNKQANKQLVQTNLVK